MSAYVHSGSERLTTSDWFTSNYVLSTDAERGCKASHDVRQESRYLRNETDNKTFWDQLDTNSRLADRVDNIRILKDLLQRSAAELEREIANLNEAKQNLEFALDQRVGLAVHINVENLVSREGRRNGDIVEDVIEVELHKEKELLEGIKQQLQQKIHESFQHLCVLQDLRQTMLTDLQNKNITLDIDVEQYNMNIDSNGISFKPDPTRRPKEMLTVKQWDDYVRFNKARADKEMYNSVLLRESILHTLEQTSSDLQAQHTATAYGYRHRLHEYAMALDELRYQKKLTEDEMADAEDEIRRLQEAIAIKVGFSKVAQTRLENRLTRPNEEMCQDNVQFGLQDEVKQLAATTQSLHDKLRQQQHALHCMELNLHRLNEAIEIKLNSQHIDDQCLASRDKMLPIHPVTGPELNKRLVGINRLREQVLPY